MDRSEDLFAKPLCGSEVRYICHKVRTLDTYARLMGRGGCWWYLLVAAVCWVIKHRRYFLDAASGRPRNSLRKGLGFECSFLFNSPWTHYFSWLNKRTWLLYRCSLSTPKSLLKDPNRSSDRACRIECPRKNSMLIRPSHPFHRNTVIQKKKKKGPTIFCKHKMFLSSC